MRPRAGASKVTMVRPGSPGRRSSDAPLAGREGLGDGADVLVGHVADAPLERLVAPAVDLPGDDLGPADLQLVALAAHRLDEHGELQLAPAGHLDHVGRVGVLDADRHVAEHLALEALPQVARREVPARPCPASGRGVDAEGHAQHRLVDGEAGQGRGVVGRGDGVADLDLGEAGHDEQVAGVQLLDLDPADARGTP